MKLTAVHPAGAAITQTLPVPVQSRLPDEDEVLAVVLAPPPLEVDVALELALELVLVLEPPPLDVAVDTLAVEPWLVELPDVDAPPFPPTWMPPVAKGQPVSEAPRRKAAPSAAQRGRCEREG